MSGIAQENHARTETVSMRVTLAEKRALEMVAVVHGKDGGVSELLRDGSFREAIEEAERLYARLRNETAPDRP